MQYHRVADTAELGVGTMKKVTVAGQEVLLANVDGSYYAIANKCTHLGGSLANGTLKGSVVSCPRHGAQFDVKTGESVGAATILVIKQKPKDTQTYAVKVEGTSIMVGIP